MSDDSNDLSRRKLLGGITTIGAASAVAGAGTFAAFADSAETDTKTISTGTVRLSDDNPTVTGFDPGLLSPGDSFSGSVSVTYEGSLEADVYLGMALLEGSENLDEADSEDLSATEFAEGLSLVASDSTETPESGAVLDGSGFVERDGFTDGNSLGIGIYSGSEINLGGGDGPATLAGLNSLLAADDGYPQYKYAHVFDGDTLTINLKCRLDEDVGQEFQDESLKIRFFFHVVEKDEDPMYNATNV